MLGGNIDNSIENAEGVCRYKFSWTQRSIPTGVSFIPRAWIMHSEAKSTPFRPRGQRATATTFDPYRLILPTKKQKNIVHPGPTTFYKQTHMDYNVYTILGQIYIVFFSASCNIKQEQIKCLLPFFFKKLFLVAKGLWDTFGFWRNLTAVVIWKETSVDVIPNNEIMRAEEDMVFRKVMLSTVQTTVSPFLKKTVHYKSRQNPKWIHVDSCF